MAKCVIGVRDVENEVFNEFKARAIQERLNLGVALTLAMKNWLKDGKNKIIKKKTLDAITPVKFGEEKLKWSQEIDEVLYGG